jgi:hypothetical protein
MKLKLLCLFMAPVVILSCETNKRGKNIPPKESVVELIIGSWNVSGKKLTLHYSINNHSRKYLWFCRGVNGLDEPDINDCVIEGNSIRIKLRSNVDCYKGKYLFLPICAAFQLLPPGTSTEQQLKLVFDNPKKIECVVLSIGYYWGNSLKNYAIESKMGSDIVLVDVQNCPKDEKLVKAKK